MSNIEELVRELPDDLRHEVEDYARFLLEKRIQRPQGKLKLSWRGALRDERGAHTAVQLQHKLRESWGQ